MNIFIHIPKTAGSTLRRITRYQSTNQPVYFLNGESPLQSKQQLIEKGHHFKARLIFGHLDFGFHEQLPGTVRYLTLFRNPIDRIISHYYYVRRTPGHYLFEVVTKSNMPLKEYVGSGLTTELNNGQVRAVIGAGGYHKDFASKYDIPFGHCKEWMLGEAITNLQNSFSFYGMQERFDESLILLKKELGWTKPLFYETKNKTKGRPAVNALDKETLEVITSYNQLDIVLYKYVKDEFEQLMNKRKNYLKKEKRKLKFNNWFLNQKRRLKPL